MGWSYLLTGLVQSDLCHSANKGGAVKGIPKSFSSLCSEKSQRQTRHKPSLMAAVLESQPSVRGSLKDQVQAGLNPAFPGIA